ncbi:AMP-binding protein [Mesorhizobium marinum]|uniref:AMP-binding protein n=1 Tax=Mesorhizobium marinum TaxID=3228790 RepID=UPI0034679B60
MTASLWHNKRPDEFDISLARAFDDAAGIYPERIAVDTGQRQVSFAHVGTAAAGLARRLIASGAAPSDRVAILMAHGAPAIAAVVGVVKAGCVVVGLNCIEPTARLRQLLDDAEPAAIVTDRENACLAGEIAAPGVNIVVFELDDGEQASGSAPSLAGGADTAALVYTSGSTGRPKGVMKTHRQICRNVSAHSQAMRYSRADRIPLFSSIGTGQGTTVIWCALLNGATLCPYPIRARGFAGLAKWIADLQLTVFVSSASILRSLVGSLDDGVVFNRIRAVRLASEAVTAGDVGLARKHFLPGCEFVHTLSSSETGNIAWARWNASDELPDGRLPVGRVSRDIEVLLLGEDGEPVRPGEIGEIVVKSRYVAAGYWRDPELTEKRFSLEPDGGGKRLVRSGDLARLDAAGRLEFCGRKDSRIKIRGNRIELSDVEWALKGVPGVEQAAVVAVPRAGGEAMLVAFVVAAPGATLSASGLRHAASASMSLQMLPSRIVFLDSMPLGASGKADRELLRAHKFPRQSMSDPPRGATERMVADIWAEALDLPDVGRDDDFFEAGGDSLVAAVVAAHLHSAVGLEISLAAIAANPTVAALAAHVDAAATARKEPPPPIVRVSRTGPAPLSPYQERVWRAVGMMQGHTTIVRSYEISGPLDRMTMENAFGFLVERHEIFRTTFSVVAGQPVQTVHPSGPLGFSFVDVSGESDPATVAERLSSHEAVKPIDASVLPTMRLMLIRLGPQLHWLLRVGHVLGQDPSSFAMVMNEFALLYEAEVRGLPPPMPKDLPLQYVDFAVWHREVMRPDGHAFQRSLHWWKGVFARRLRTTRLPFPERRASGGATKHATCRWRLDAGSSERLDTVARQAGATHFVIRLACFLALVAQMCGRSTAVIGTGFTNRQRLDTTNIAGSFTNLAPLVVPYRRDLSLQDWVKTVRDGLFETEENADIPLEQLYESLRRSGLRPPPIKALFMMTSGWSEQRIGDITIRRRPHPLPEMPWGFQMYVDQGSPAHCRIEFDADRYRPEDVKSFADIYVGLLEVAASNPDVSIGTLVANAQGGRFDRLIATARRALGQS